MASDGAKHVLGLREGSTENSTVAKAMLSELIDRGLSTERPILFVIDGGKGLRKAITELFASAAVVQRCLSVDLGLAIGQPLPAVNSRQAAEVTRRVMVWAAQVESGALTAPQDAAIDW